MIFNQVKRAFVKSRLSFIFFEITAAFLLIFVITSFEWILLPFQLNPELFGMIFYISRSLIILFAIPITTTIINKLKGTSKRIKGKVSESSAYKSHFMLYLVSKSNFKYQLLYGVLLLFLVFIPLNFFLYLLTPEMLLYHVLSIGSNLQNSYLFINNFLIFFVISLLIQISNAISQESIYRGFVTKRGSEQFNPISAVLISAYSYGFLSFLYYLDPISSIFSFWYPLVWFLALFLIGLTLSLTTIRRKWLFPSIFANGINGIIMISIFWFYINGGKYMDILVLIYLPLLIGSIILILWQYRRIRESISIGITLLKNYFKKNANYNERNNHKYFLTLFDIIAGFLLFLIGLLITL
jgi:membrane protease YdiL (CAAX protease family)